MTDADDQADRDPAYFAYYGQLQHQQNMLADHVRTSAYHRAITQRFAGDCFRDKRVMDVGAGSGILSFFACQAGAKEVLAVEASLMAGKLEAFIRESVNAGKNVHWLPTADRIRVFNKKLENIDHTMIPPKSVDTIISEPIGVLLVHERMLESFVLARDKFLKPDGCIFPTTGTICISPFTDQQLWTDTVSKAQWWHQSDFFGVDVTLHADRANNEYFAMPVVGSFAPHSLLCSQPNEYLLDFRTVTVDDLQTISIPIRWTMNAAAVMHGIAGWFTCDFTPEKCNEKSENRRHPRALTLSTHPADPVTHWQQVRFLFHEPLAVNRQDVICGFMKLVTNQHRSYDITVELWIEDEPGQKRTRSQRTGRWDLHEQTYNYSYTPFAAQSSMSSHFQPTDSPTGTATADVGASGSMDFSFV